MKNLWNDTEAAKCKDDLDYRVYTSRLLGASDDLVLHGGGNTSVKIKEKDIFGNEQEILYVKGSGWNLGTIERPGFSPCRNDYLVKLADLETLTDTEMVKECRISLTEPSAPNASVEAILHAIIPKKFVDHTHADAVATISNTPDGEEKLRQIYGDKVMILPYVMPGFILAKQIKEATAATNWEELEAIILLNHGIFTFSDDPKVAYSNMIEKVTLAEEFIKSVGAHNFKEAKAKAVDYIKLAQLRAETSKLMGKATLARLKSDDFSVGYTQIENIEDIGRRGTITPDHVITTKALPAIMQDDPQKTIEDYAKEYEEYFNRNNPGDLTILDKSPRYLLWKDVGVVCFSPNIKRLIATSDIVEHTMKCVQWGENLGGWKPLDEKNLFDLEYWELEQAKLKKTSSSGEFDSKIVLVSGSASGIGKAIVEEYSSKGACVVALDINPEVASIFNQPNTLGIQCDVTDTDQLKAAIHKTIETFGGIDILVSNAGSFPPSTKIEEMSDEAWQKAIDLNFTSHMKVIREATPFLKLGIDPSIILIASKNVPAPGPGQAAYSSSKAAITQLARVSALELGKDNIRVNVVHPNAVFDTGVWSDEVIKSRAENYNLSVEEYKTNNILKTEITSKHVANLVRTMTSKDFSKTTGAQVPIDGGNDRVI